MNSLSMCCVKWMQMQLRNSLEQKETLNWIITKLVPRFPNFHIYSWKSKREWLSNWLDSEFTSSRSPGAHKTGSLNCMDNCRYIIACLQVSTWMQTDWEERADVLLCTFSFQALLNFPWVQLNMWAGHFYDSSAL